MGKILTFNLFFGISDYSRITQVRYQNAEIKNILFLIDFEFLLI